jgi:hypothetical protein
VGSALLASMQRKRTLCLHRLAKDRNQARQFSQFLANAAVSSHEILVTAARRTNRRAAGRHAQAVMDTTDLLFSTHEASKNGLAWAATTSIRACSFTRSSRLTRTMLVSSALWNAPC